MFVPLIHPPGHGQADFGEARAVIGGVARKTHFFVFDLPHSDACYVRAYPAATAEAWIDGHSACLRLLRRGSAIGATTTTAAWCRASACASRPPERNFMVPLPRFTSREAFNLRLEEQCRRQGDILRGHRETIGERLVRDLAAMATPPAAPFEACAQAPGQVSSQSLVRYETNDYSVPVAYGHRDVWVRGYVDRVVIGCGGEVIPAIPGPMSVRTRSSSRSTICP